MRVEAHGAAPAPGVALFSVGPLDVVTQVRVLGSVHHGTGHRTGALLLGATLR